MRVRDFLLTTDEIVEILTADNSDGKEELQLDEKDLQILEENINEGNPKVVTEEVTGKDSENAFVNQNFSEKDETNDFCIESSENCKWTKIIKEPKAADFQKQHLLGKLCESCDLSPYNIFLKVSNFTNLLKKIVIPESMVVLKVLKESSEILKVRYAY